MSDVAELETDESGDPGAPPEPAPVDWAPPVPLDSKPAQAPAPPTDDEADVRAYNRTRRFWTTTLVFALLWLAGTALLHTEGGWLLVLLLVAPIYLLTLPFVLRKPRRHRRAKVHLVERAGWHARLMVGVAVFLALYIPFALFSNAVIPFAPLVEYVLFALLLLLLLRLAGRSTGVAPSLEALPPANHRLHQQVIAAIDDLHYQNTLWLNYAFVEKGRGAKHLARRLDEVLDSNGVGGVRRAELLSPLHGYREPAGFALTRRGRERRTAGRERRSQMLEAVLSQMSRELEQRA